MDQITDKSPSMERKATAFQNGDFAVVDIEAGTVIQPGSPVSPEARPQTEAPRVRIGSKRRFNTTQISPGTKKAFYIFSVSSVICVIILTWLLLSLPHLCYFEVWICSQLTADSSNRAIPNVKDSSNMTCTGIEYTGVCQAHFNSCSKAQINLNISDSTENRLRGLFIFLSEPTPQYNEASCFEVIEELKTFLCRYAYQPCDDLGQILVPSRNQCIYFRDVMCPQGWELLVSLYRDQLPDCETLPVNPTESFCNKTSQSTIAPTPTSTTSTTEVFASPTPEESSGDTDTCVLTYPGTTCAQSLTLCSDSQPAINTYDSDLDGSLTTASAFLISGTCGIMKSFVVEFLCHAAFQPCDDNDNIHLPNRTTCEYIRDTVCRSEWSLLANTQWASLLPDCSSLPITSTPPSCPAVIPQTTPTIDPAATSSTTSPTPIATQLPTNSSNEISFQCNEEEGFHLYITYDPNSTILNNTCQARCSEWIMFDRLDSTLRDIAILISAAIGAVSAVVFFFFTILRYKRMFVFPSMFIVYQTITLLVVGATTLIQYTDRRSLSCPPDDLVITALSVPTPFCSFAGFVFLYCIVSLAYWWIVHVASTFWKVMFPFHARKHEKKTAYIHVILLIVGIILPAITPLVCLLTDGYFIGRLPALFCAPVDRRILYYGVLLPVSLILGVGISFILIILHVLHQKQRLFKYRTKVSYFLGLSTAEKKLLLIFIYYVLLSVVYIIAHTNTSLALNNLTDAILDNFVCETYPIDPTYQCPRDYQKFHNVFSVLTYILGGLFPCFNLLFAVNVSEINDKLCSKKCKVKLESQNKTKRSSIISTEAPSTPFSLHRKMVYSVSNVNKQSASSVVGASNGTYIQDSSI